MPPAHTVLEVKAILAFLAGAVEIVEHAQAFGRVQFLAVRIQLRQAGCDLMQRAVKKRPRFLCVLLMYGYRDIPLLHHAARRAGNLIHQHVVVLRTAAVERIVSARQ